MSTDIIERGHFRFVPEGDWYRLHGLDTHPTRAGGRGGLVWGPDAVAGEAWVGEKAQVSGQAQVYDQAQVSDRAWVSGEARVYDQAQVSARARVYGEAWVGEEALVSGEAWVYGEAWVGGKAQVYSEAQVYGQAQVSGKARVSGNAWVYGEARVYGEAWVYGEARVYDSRHVLTVGPVASEDCHATLAHTKDGHLLTVGCWWGTIDELVEMVTGDSWPAADTPELRALHRPELLALAELCRARIATWDGEATR